MVEKLAVNAEILRWARERAGYTVVDIARIKKYSGYPNWEQGTAEPSKAILRDLAKKFNRTYIEFYLDQVPQVTGVEQILDFRSTRLGAPPPSFAPIKEWAEAQRHAAIEMLELLGLRTLELPQVFSAELTNSPDVAAKQVRSALGYGQGKYKGFNSGELLKELVGALERYGVLVFQKKALKGMGVRGFCLASRPLPVIVLGDESKAALAFTLMHELGHVVLNRSGISGEESRDNLHHKVETWCNRFSGAILVDADDLRAKAKESSIVYDDRGQVSHLARYGFGVSEHALSVRMVQLGLMDADYYWNTLKKQLEEEFEQKQSIAKEKARKRAEEDKKQGKSPGGGSEAAYMRAKRESGEFYSSLVISAMRSDKILVKHALRYLDMSKMGDLSKLEAVLPQAGGGV